MGNRLVDLNNVRYFVEAARGRNFSAAARIFDEPPSMISRKIAQLEREVGSRLFQRTTRSFQLTVAGSVFLDHALANAEQFQRALEALSELQVRPRGKIRLSASAASGDVLWEAIAVFMEQYPEVQVEMDFVDRFVDLSKKGFNLAIRSARGESFARLVGRRLVPSPRLLLASPRYLKSRGEPRSIQDLAKHECVILGGRVERAIWTLKVGSVNRKIVVSGRVAVNEARIAVSCALRGQGIAFLPRAPCAAYLAEGKLIRVLPRVSGGDMSLWLVYPDRRLSAAARALTDFLANTLPATLSRIDPGQGS